MTSQPAAEPPWADSVRARLRAARIERGISLHAIDATAPAATVTAMERAGGDWTTGTSRNLYLHHVSALAALYGVSTRWLVTGSGRKRRTHSDGGLDAQLRERLRHHRLAAGMSLDVLNQRAGIARASRYFTRVESGEIQWLDLIRLERAARILHADIGAWLTPADPAEATPSTPRARRARRADRP